MGLEWIQELSQHLQYTRQYIPVAPSSTGICGKPGTGCDVMYQTA